MVSTLDMIEADRAAVGIVESTSRDELRVIVNRQSFVDSRALAELAREFSVLGEIEDALACFGVALEKDPLFWEAYVGRAEVVQGLFIMRDEQGSESSLGSWACADLEKALTCVDPQNRNWVLRLLLTAYLLGGKYEEAKLSAMAALRDGVCEAGSEQNDVVYSLGFAELFLGNEVEAITLFRSLPAEYEGGLFGKALCELRMGNVTDVESTIARLSDRYCVSFDFLRANGFTGYLTVVRSLYVADVSA